MLSKRLIFTLLIAIASQSLWALSLDQRRQAIIGIIDEELNEIQRLSSAVNARNPDYLLRMAELNLEKARLWREKENEAYLEMSDDQRRRTNRAKYFSRSASYFQQANRLAVALTKEFPSYKDIADVYYILGYNAKEAGREELAQKYLANAVKKSNRNEKTKIKSQISLAETYYNQRQYKKAIPLYESSLSRHKDKWWTKDSFNLAWSYYRNNQSGAAINKAIQVYEQSKNSQFVDMRSHVERDIALFYATSGRIDEGVRFYENLGINFTDQLLRVAQTLKSDGKYTEAEKALGYAANSEKRPDKMAEIRLDQLDLYETFGKDANHLKISRSLYSLFQSDVLDSRQTQRFLIQVQKQASKLQKQVTSKTYRRVKKTRQRKADQAIEYFTLAEKLDSKNAHVHVFYKAETAYANYEFSKALPFYIQAFDGAKAAGDRKVLVSSIEGQLAALGQKKLPEKVKDNYYAQVYERYLNEWPQGQKAQTISKRLFNVYYSKGEYTKAKEVLDRYVENYPRDWKGQEAMIANLMEVARKNKDHGQIRQWIAAIDAGKYTVGAPYKVKLRELLTSIQIEGVQQSLDKGDKSVALRGYHQILKDPNSTPKSKINAKYNLAALYYELGDVAKSYQWSVEVLQEMQVRDVMNFSDSFLTISSFLFAKQQFAASADLSTRFVAKLCSHRVRKRSVAFNNAIQIQLAQGDIKKTQELIVIGERCKIPSQHLRSARLELAQELSDKNQWNDYEKLVGELYQDKNNHAQLITHLHRLEREHARYNNLNKVSFYKQAKLQAYKNALNAKKDVELAALDVIAAEELEQMTSLASSLSALKLQFPEQEFNRALKRKFEVLDQLTAKASQIQKIGSGKGIVKTYQILSQAFEDTANEILSFSPVDKSESYIASFRKEMTGVANPLKVSAQGYRAEAWEVINENRILSENNYSLAPAAVSGVVPKHAYPNKAVIMDRRGRR